MIGFIATSVTISLNYNQYRAIAHLLTFQSNFAHALGLSVSTSRPLATDLNTETSTQSLWSLLVISCSIALKPRNSTELRLLLSLPAYSLLRNSAHTENICDVIATQPAHWSAGCCLAMVSTRAYRKHITWPLPTLLWRYRVHKENTTPVLLVPCVLQALPSNGFTWHNIMIGNAYKSRLPNCMGICQFGDGFSDETILITILGNCLRGHELTHGRF
jgi:hypothetical protein